MSTFHVFVEGAVDPATGALERLAEAMEQRYGLPAVELVSRMNRGRFRVKANIDRATADTYARDLQAIGARVVIEEGRVQATSIPAPNVPTTPAKPQFQSGLAAAFTGDSRKMDLGALATGESEPIRLSSIDGQSIGLSSSAGDDSFTPPVLAAARFKSPSIPAPQAGAVDMFAPPDQESADVKMDIADDELAYRARKSSLPPQNIPATPLRRQAPSIPPETKRAPVGGLLAQPRARMVIGMVLAIGLGFIPAHVIASIRETSAFHAIDADVLKTQAKATTVDEISGLDTFRASQIARKKSERRNIALVSMLIWMLVGTGLGYVWFRRVPWDRITGGQ